MQADIRQSEQYANYMRSLGWIVEKIDDTNVFIKKILWFSVIKIQRPNKLDLNKLKILQKKYRAIKTNIEPGSDWHLIPTKTVIIDLENLNIPKDTRYEIRKAEKSLVAGCHPATQENILKEFVKLWHQNARDRGFWIPISKEINNLARTFNNDSYLFLSSLCSSSSTSMIIYVSGALFIRNNDTVHYMYAFSTPTGRKLSSQYLLLSEAIKYFKKLGVKKMDLEGIYDERYPNENRSWLGFTKFKMGWGGKAMEY